jgi:UDP-glucose 4-epimerase
VYVDDVAEATIRAVTSPDVSGEVINVGTGLGRSVKELLASIQALIGRETDPLFLPARPGDPMSSVASPGKCRRLLNFSPMVSFDEGLRRAADWYASSSLPH